MSETIVLPPDRPLLADGAKLGGWWHRHGERDRIVCDLCPRACALKPGDRGFCFVRENRAGQMVLSTYGRSTGFCIDPIEKKPLNHFFPGTSVLSFGTAGCNLGCQFCQNWSISKSREVERLSEQATPDAIAAAAQHWNCHSVAFTYNDPVVWAEYAIDTARACRRAGIKAVAVTAGYIAESARDPFFSEMDAANVDLKAFTEEFYQKLTLSHLQPVLDTLVWLRRETNVWFEITNLVIPQSNDSDDELRRLCEWVLQHVGDGVPVHFTAFHPDFRLRDRSPTPLETLLRGFEIARQTGLKYPYVGNVNDVQHQSTHCPSCRKLVIERNWYELGEYHLQGNRCAHCGATIAGHFEAQPGSWGRRRVPVRIGDFAQPPAVIASLDRPSNQVSAAAKDDSCAASNCSADPTASPNSSSEDKDMSTTTGSNSKGMLKVQVQAPSLSDDQRRVVHREACWLVACASQGYKVSYLDPEMSGAAETSVLGCFVTLKRRGKLRACCGFVGRSSTLSAALHEAAVSTATRDVRLPALSGIELSHLNVEVSVLHNLQPIEGSGEARRDAVQVGRHGLQIMMGQSRGLLLPSVATEHNLDAEQFLQHVCIKAGLPPTAWKSREAQLWTYEGLVFGGPFDPYLIAAWDLESRPLLDDGQVQELAAVCKSNIVAFATGAVPTYVVPHVPDPTAHGIAMFVRWADRDEPIAFGRLSLRPGIPLQSTLVEMCQAATNVLRRSGLDPSQVAESHVDLAVLHDPAMHGTVSEPDLAGVISPSRAIFVTHHNRSCWVADRQLDPNQRMLAAQQSAAIENSHAASVYSFETASTVWPVRQVSVPQPVADLAPRPPAVAGMFYPAEPHAARQEVESLFAAADGPRQRWRGAMIPHAGWKYSGRVAATVLARLEVPETVIVLGPKHTRLGVDWAVASCESWELPGGVLANDLELARNLVERIPNLQLDSNAHLREHAIEVQLPLLARVAPHTRVVGVAIGTGDLADCRRFADGLAEALRERTDSVLLLISSDMNHFATDEETRRLDELALACIDQLDAARLYQVVRDHHISMCGLLPAVMVLETLARLRPLQRAQRVAYATTADTTGDPRRVVGYAGVLID